MPEYETKRAFSKNLIRLLDSSGETQIQLANALGVSKSTVSSWCTAEKMPRMDKIEAIARHFGISKSDLLATEQEDIGFDDFTYALYGEARALTEENKQKLLEMARFFRQLEQRDAQAEQKKNKPPHGS